MECKSFSVLNESRTEATFSFTEEGHTLGNAIRYFLIKNSDVDFVGYSVPHPAESRMNIRVQTKTAEPLSTLEAALFNLDEYCDLLLTKLEKLS
jgi:DNA-directed RNA polymerase I and III subunit RPAC2